MDSLTNTSNTSQKQSSVSSVNKNSETKNNEQTPEKKKETVSGSNPSSSGTTSTSSTKQTSKNNNSDVGDKEVRNDIMINKIKKVIESNPSENMLKFGYSIQIDSSIKSQTNQFTFTESRVLNYIKYSFGTIKIYAEDWYKNGAFTMTACYIL